MFKIIIFLIILTSNTLFASSAIKIHGITANINDGSSVQLIQHKYFDVEVAKTFVMSSEFKFNILDSLADGVYSIVLTNQISASKIDTFKYNIILDKSEDFLKFKINPYNQAALDIVSSKINANYYDFLSTENFRVAVIKYIMAEMNSGGKSALKPLDGLKDILEREVKELKEIRLNYIKANFNKWSTELVKNSTTILLYENVNKENYWSFFSTNNANLINTPIFQNLIQYYLINYFGVATENDYKVGFEEVIRHFSYNVKLKEWVVNYIIVGLNQLGNRNLIDFFEKKYNCKT